MKKKVKFLRVLIRRDAHTTTPTTVAEHELPVLRSIYGKESIVVDNESAQSRQIETDGEYGRLANKFGLEALVNVYGDEESGRLDDSYKVFAPPSRTAAEVNKNGSQDPAGQVLTAAANGMDPSVVTRDFDPAATPAGGATIDPRAVKVDVEGTNKPGAARAAARRAQVADKPLEADKQAQADTQQASSADDKE